VLARYDGNIEYTFDEGSASSSPEHAAATVKVVESHQQLYVEFETKAWFLVGVVWQMTDLPPDRFGLTPLKPASNRTCPVNSWTAQGSADLTLNHAQVAISGRVQGDDCEEDFDRQMFITFSGDVVR
jgi:hypothetical protein